MLKIFVWLRNRLDILSLNLDQIMTWGQVCPGMPGVWTMVNVVEHSPVIMRSPSALLRISASRRRSAFACVKEDLR